MLKLNLGSGNFNFKGYENIDIDQGRLAYPLNYDDNTVDEILASHLLEHFSYLEVPKVLAEWGDKLKPGGVLKLGVPDFRKITDNYRAGGDKGKSVLVHVMGSQVDENDLHKCIFDRNSLTQLLTQVGFIDIEDWTPENYDTSSLDVSLNLKARKPGGENKLDDLLEVKQEEISNAVKPIEASDKNIKISAIMSMPRLAHTENLFCAMKSLIPLGISLEKGTGVFWGQVLTRLIEGHLDDGTDFILTIDYDTWFTFEHVQRLMQLMVENDDVDALVPLQMHRENNNPLLGLVPDEGEKKKIVEARSFFPDLTIIDSGHFGLTLLRMDALRKMPKPWFLAVPDENGGWDDGRLDEDIYFWKNFRENGGKICSANNVKLGHIQMMCTFPGLPQNQFKPIHAYLTDIEKGRIPDGMIPKIEIKK